MNSVKRVALIAAIASMCVAGAASSAGANDGAQTRAAYPSECQYENMGSWGGRALCKKSNGGSFRAVVHCESVTTGRVQGFFGPWAKTGTSTAYCHGDGKALFTGVDLSARDNT